MRRGPPYSDKRPFRTEEAPPTPEDRKSRGKRQSFATSKNKCRRRDATQVVQEDRGGLGGDGGRKYEYQRDNPREFHELRVRQDTPPRRAEPDRRPKRGRQVFHPPRNLRRSRPGLHREVEEAERPHKAREGDSARLSRLRQSSRRGQEAHPVFEVGDIHAEQVPEKRWLLLVRGRLQGDRQERSGEAPAGVRPESGQPPDHNAPGDDRGAGGGLLAAEAQDGRGGGRVPRVPGKDSAGRGRAEGADERGDLPIAADRQRESSPGVLEADLRQGPREEEVPRARLPPREGTPLE